jgi:hypothetical protein
VKPSLIIQGITNIVDYDCFGTVRKVAGIVVGAIVNYCCLMPFRRVVVIEVGEIVDYHCPG